MSYENGSSLIAIMDKHAYLIIAYQCDDTYKTLLKMLDDK